MRLALLLVVFLAGSPALGQQPSQPERGLTPTEKTWFVLTAITSADDADRFRNLRHYGFSKEGIRALLVHVRAGTEALNHLSTESVVDLCENGARYRDNSEELARKFEREHTEYSARMQQLVDSVWSILNDGDEVVLKSILARKEGKMGGFNTDVPASIRSGVITPNDAVKRACDQVEKLESREQELASPGPEI